MPLAGNPRRGGMLNLRWLTLRLVRLQIVSGVEQNRKLTLNDPNVRFEVDWWNGFNSSITIIDPPYTGVVAMLYALEPERQRFLNQDAIIYTPYSSALLQTELVEAGKNLPHREDPTGAAGAGTRSIACVSRNVSG